MTHRTLIVSALCYLVLVACNESVPNDTTSSVGEAEPASESPPSLAEAEPRAGAPEPSHLPSALAPATEEATPVRPERAEESRPWLLQMLGTYLPVTREEALGLEHVPTDSFSPTEVLLEGKPVYLDLTQDVSLRRLRAARGRVTLKVNAAVLGRRAFRAALARLGEIGVGLYFASDVDDGDLESLRGLDQIQMVDLRRTNVGDAGLQHLSQLSALHFLTLEGTPVTDEGMRHLSSLSDLESLFVGHSRLGSAGVAHLTSLTRLRRLGLQDTQIDDACFEQLRGFEHLEELHLSGTSASRDAIGELAAVRPYLRLF